MPITAAAPPQSVPAFGGFDYVAVDPARGRAYAAHTSSNRLLVVSRDGTLGQVRVGPMHGVAVDPATGVVFTGNGNARTVSKVDPVALKVLATVSVPGSVDSIAYDPSHGRIFADEDGGGHVYVIDAATMTPLATLAMPSGDLESVAVDPASGTAFQNLADGGGFAVIDPKTLAVARVVKTPQLDDPHPMVVARAAQQVITGGVNGVLSAYGFDGTHLGDVAVPPHIDQCSTGARGDRIVCAGRGVVTVLEARPGAAPRIVATIDTGHPGVHTAGIDETTGDVWIVWSDASGDWVQRLHAS